MTSVGPPRIGLLGGTFNPVHLGHLVVAQCAMETFDLERVLFIPSALPPHKDASTLPTTDHRLAMLEQAIEGDWRFDLSDIEVRRGGTSYTYDTVRELRQEHRDTELCFIIGADSLLELHLWYQIEKLLPLCRFVTLARPGTDLSELTPDDLKLPGLWGERLLRDVAMGCEIDISSSDIRHRIAEGMSIRYLVPASVEMYIAEHGLYGT